MTKLSPAALTVWSAFLDHYKWEVTQTELRALAAALRAVANQIPYLPKNCSSYDVNMQDGREEVREKFLAIACELDAQ